jgi:hypothetical protein
MLRTSLVLLGLVAALPAAAQDRGGLQLRGPSLTLSKIEANQAQGCPLSSTSVTVGVNRASGFGSSAQQRLGTVAGPTNGCRPLVSTQVVAGVNLALAGRSNAGQSIAAQGPSGVLATETFTRGFNIGQGAFSTANQRLSNITR